MHQFAGDQAFDLAIAGMSCASCISRVEKSLGRVPGVQNVAVNLATESARIMASRGTRLPALIEAVEKAGYRVERRTKAAGRRELNELLAAIALSLPLLLGMFAGLPGWIAFALATPVQFWLGARFYAGAWRALSAGSADMDLLVALGTSAAYLLSVVDLLTSGPLYFESSAIVITLIRLGKFLEGRAKQEAAGAVAGLAALRPALAHLAAGTDVPVQRLKPGDLIDLRPGERVPMDGEIVAGAGSLDESHITGESIPVFRAPGAKVLAGTLNLNAVLRMSVTSAQGETLLDRMARLISDAQASKPAVQRLADKVAAIFVPVVLGIAALTLCGWLLVHAPLATAVINAVSVLVIACPCALGLATPAAILAGTGVAAKHGILIRNADAIDRAARVTLVVFDKTGTLTEGHPRLTDIWTMGARGRNEAREIAAALAAGDTHPLSDALRLRGIAPAESLRVLPGRGVEGCVGGRRYILGSGQMIRDAGGEPPRKSMDQTISYLATADGEMIAGFAFADNVRPAAKAAIDRLRKQGLGVKLLSGDRDQAAEAIGFQLGITDIVAEATPELKLAVIDDARRGGQIVAMVGDGVNDAAALAAADVGIAIGTGADVAIEAADLALLRPEPALVVDALDLSKRIRRTLREGLFWAVIYNVVGIPLAALGYLSPMVAGAAMAASSLCVLGNALRLRTWRPA